MKIPTLYRVLVSVLLYSVLSISQAEIPVAAKSAMEQGNYAQAIPMLLQLANAGDAAANYNLAMIYQKGLGVSKDGVRARSFMIKAAQRGLVDGYTNLSSNSIRPVSNTHTLKRIDSVLTPKIWVLSQNPNHYTLQLASSTNVELIQKYYQENNLEQTAGYYKDVRAGEEWYALVYGSYPSVKDANDAIATLPQGLRKWSPWVRKLDKVQKIIRDNDS